MKATQVDEHRPYKIRGKYEHQQAYTKRLNGRNCIKPMGRGYHMVQVEC